EDRADQLHLAAKALRPERPDRAVDHAGRQNRPLGRTALSLEETAGDLPGRIHALFDVDGEREEVRSLTRFHPPLGGGKHHGLSGTDEEGAVRLLGELARLEDDLLPPDGQRDRRHSLGGHTHVISSTSYRRVEV